MDRPRLRLSNDFWIRLAACFLLVWTPYFLFSSFRDHPIPAGALVYSVAVFAVPALGFTLLAGGNRGIRHALVLAFLVSLFLDLQTTWFDGVLAAGCALVVACLCWLLREHLALILVCVLGAMLAGTVLIPSNEQYVETWSVEGGAPVGDKMGADPPAGTLIHIILDEFAGLGGIPEDIAGGQLLTKEIAEFFRSYGFELRANAISQYVSTKVSISSMLNFEAGETPEQNYRGKRPFILTSNRYFETLHERGYSLSVYQSTYLDYCAEAPVPLARCLTYRYDGTDWLRSADLSDFQKMTVLLGMLLNHPGILETFWKSYVGLRLQARQIGISLPVVMAWDGRVAPLASSSAFRSVRDTVAAASPGTAHFIHVLLPHSPYAFGSDCGLRDKPLTWLSHHPLHRRGNSPAGRDQRYGLYFEQVRCTLRQLGGLFDALKAEGNWDHAEIVLHGDHGSRLYERAPRAEARSELTPRDLADGFSTLFASKTNRGPMVTDDGAGPVWRMLAETLKVNVGPGEQDSPLLIYLQGREDDSWVAYPWSANP